MFETRMGWVRPHLRVRIESRDSTDEPFLILGSCHIFAIGKASSFPQPNNRNLSKKQKNPP